MLMWLGPPRRDEFTGYRALAADLFLHARNEFKGRDTIPQPARQIPRLRNQLIKIHWRISAGRFLHVRTDDIVHMWAAWTPFVDLQAFRENEAKADPEWKERLWQLEAAAEKMRVRIKKLQAQASQKRNVSPEPESLSA